MDVFRSYKLIFIIFIIGVVILSYHFYLINEELYDLKIKTKENIVERIKERENEIKLREEIKNKYLIEIKKLDEKIDSIELKIKKNNKILKDEKPNYYFDINSQFADSVITNSRYRYYYEKNNLRQVKEN